MQPEKNPNEIRRRWELCLGSQLFPEKLWGKALSHWCVTAVGSVTDLWYHAEVQQMINVPQQSDPRLWLCDRDAFR